MLVGKRAKGEEERERKKKEARSKKEKEEEVGEAGCRKSRLDGGRKLPISMEITSSSPLFHGSLMARQKENGFSSYYSA